MPSIIKRKGAVTKCEGILSQLLFAFQNIFELLVEGYWLLVSKSYHILCLLTSYRLLLCDTVYAFPSFPVSSLRYTNRGKRKKIERIPEAARRKQYHM